ncbi:MAG: alpha-amylase [Anaerolineae bacterium]|nr:alpha-amylase [Anaerolineae bacterium]
MPGNLALREFHISHNARDRYGVEDTLFALNGNVIFANFHAARELAQKINARRDLLAFPEQAVGAGQLNAMGLIDEIMHHTIDLYQQERAPQVMAQALAFLEARMGKAALDEVLTIFATTYPTTAVYRGALSAEAYLAGATGDTSHREVVLEELLLLWLSNINPARMPFLELFDDTPLEALPAYSEILTGLHDFFDTQPPFGPDNENLVDMLLAPIRKAPHSLEAQLEFIRTRWVTLLGAYLYRLLSSLDLLAEENKAFFGFGPGPEALLPFEFAGQELEVEAFSPDSDWMPQVVIIAKNAYVWLDQLSKEYEQPINRLDQIPDAELEKLASWGLTGLWLIGLWERSKASKRIKQIMGNADAVASAYSLYDYRIAEDLGGEAAYNDLKARAWKRGIRMGSDMVPNHMGIDSSWVVYHPDWFVQLPYSPFPSYTFNGEDLCEDPRVGIHLEDHYYTHSDAAVVFKRVDHWTGDARYIYHGNDGTSMPWNDTAQLNYLNPEVREAVIQTILEVARRSPIIRFDAAMTLAKRHYQRLWYPEPGTGGDIASRADYGMTKAQFDDAIPEEFWREVVDRVAVESPGTLLLAEAFWMMEGYFVRTLGMHRVYNSAFMNMLRDEKNAEYRQLIKNTLEFDPQILKRYVNFMNNPDEKTAVEQFGKGDKYFGICTLMATLPGLPMFGHGQVEGYAEKYGMEFRRAYWEEHPDLWLVARHEQQVFPLLHKRYLFAEVDHYLLFDYYTPEGRVDENVFAYTNKAGGEHSLVIYHNRFAETRGWIHTSAAYVIKGADGEKTLVQKTIADGLDIPNRPDMYIVFRDAAHNLEYLRNCAELHSRGLYTELHAYQVHVFVDFHLLQDNEWGHYGQLAAHLHGRGVPSIEEALRELFLEPLHAPLRMLISAPAFRWLAEARFAAPDDRERVSDQVEAKMEDLLDAAKISSQGTGDPEAIAHEVREKLATILALSALVEKPEAEAAEVDETVDAPQGEVAESTAIETDAEMRLRPLRMVFGAETALAEGLKADDPETLGTLLGWLFLHPLGKIMDAENYTAITAIWMDEWLLGKVFSSALQDTGLKTEDAQRAAVTIKILLDYHAWLDAAVTETGDSAYEMLRSMLQERPIQAYLGVNRYEGILWFNKEALEQLLWWVLLLATVETLSEPHIAAAAAAEEIARVNNLVRRVIEAEAVSEYQVAKLLEAARALD